jgi:dolichyl-diphosphooligosaccharide--protein glycosyltransferase
MIIFLSHHVFFRSATFYNHFYSLIFKALGVFGLCQIVTFIDYLRANMSRDNFTTLFKTLTIGVMSIVGAGLAVLTFSGKVAPWTGRFYSLLDPSYAKNNIPIIASVSEHQPTSWSSFYFDLQILTILFPAGLYYCFTRLTDHNIFIILYGVTSVYFAGVMVRLMLVLAPVMCIMGGIAVSASLSTYMKYLDVSTFTAGLVSSAPVGASSGAPNDKSKYDKKLKASKGSSSDSSTKEYVAIFFVALISLFLVTYAMHCVWATSEAYSSPSIVLSGNIFKHVF